MASNPILTNEECAAALQTLPQWQAVDGHAAIRRMYTFDSFRNAMNFFGRAMPVIERMNHHPEWANIHKRSLVVLTTHDNGKGESGVTRLDIELAKALDSLA